MNDKHIQWIDALKGFGIFSVTLGHLNPWYPLGIKETISEFFIINGKLCWNAPIWFL